MAKVQLVVDFLRTHTLLVTTLILFFMWLVRRSILSMIRGDHAFLTED
ncbi:mechanosensitive ion channel family protein, partial [Vibrio sp. 2094]|nr:mechanosensitive ion channel family protein [Vibrio sp. 2094]